MFLDLPPAEAQNAGAILLLAVVQGLTEFLPVSSSGHLVLARDALEVRDGGLALDVALHLGTLAAVLVAYRREVRQLLADLLRRRWRMWGWLVVASLPVALAGFSLKWPIERAATTPTVAALGLLFTALALLVGERRRRKEPPSERPEGPAGGPADGPADYGRPRWSDALVMGLVQALAVVPGISRSGLTISAGLARGLPVAQAARLSFLMSVPAICGAALVELPRALDAGFGGIPLGLVAGAVGLSALVGWAGLRVLLLVTARGAFRWFAGYCALLGLLALAFA